MFFLCIGIPALMRAEENSMQNMSEAIAHYYDNEARAYDGAYSTMLCKAEDRLLIDFIEPIISNKKVLDIGCGTGQILEYVSLKNYLGIDVSSEMIEIAKSKHSDNGFMVGNMDQIVKNIDSESFESIICLYGPISYSCNPVELMNEFFRILIPGGTLVVMPYTERVEKQCVIGGYSTATEKTLQKVYYTTEMFEDLLAQTKFVETQIRGINYFGNFIELMDAMYGNQHSEEFYTDLLMKERDTFSQSLPIEYARHALVIAKKQSI